MRCVDGVLVYDDDIVYSADFLQAKGYGASYAEIIRELQRSGRTQDEIEEHLDTLEDAYIKWCMQYGLIAT